MREDRTTPPGVLDSTDWDFGPERLSNRELSACHAHEYGREIAKRCSYVLTQLKILWRANELPAKNQGGGFLSGLSLFNPRPPAKLHPDRVRGNEAKAKLYLFDIPAETLGYRGHQNQSWYTLPANVRQDLVRSLRDSAGWNRGPRRSSVLFRTTNELGASGDPTTLTFLCRRETNFLRELLNANLWGSKIEYGLFAIDWNADLGVLKNQVFDWLKQQQGNQTKLPPFPKRRPSRGQLRDQLRWLGALRVKEHYGRRNLVKSNFRNVRVEAPYKKLPDLYANAKKALKIIETRIKNGTETLSS